MIGRRLRAVVALVVGLVSVMGLVSPSEAQAEDEEIRVLNRFDEDGMLTIEIALPADIQATDELGVTENGNFITTPTIVPAAEAIDVILALDTSLSMANSMDSAREAASELIGGLPASARVGIVGFGNPAQPLFSPVRDHEAALEVVARLDAEGDTALWEALVISAQLAADLGTPRPYVIVLSDGENDLGDDPRDAPDQADAVTELRRAGAGLFAIAFGNSDRAALSQITGAVGGEVLRADDQDQLGPIFDDIGERLANRYYVRYPSEAGLQREVTIATIGLDDQVLQNSFTIPGRPVSAGSEPTAARPAPPLAQPRAAAVPVVDGPALNVFSRPETLLAGLGAFFLAFLIGALFIVIPASEINIDTAAGADRMAAVRNRVIGLVDRLLQSSDSGGRFERALDLSGIHLRSGEFAMIAFGLTVLVFLIFSYLAGVPTGIVMVLVASVGLVSYVNVKVSRRRQKFADQLTDALGVLAGSLRAGRSLGQAMEYVAQESAPPTSEEFQRILFETRVGRDITESMLAVAERMESNDFGWVADAVDINREVGGDLTEVLDNVAGTIRDRRAVVRQARALSSEGRATGWVLLGTPLALFAFLAYQTPDSIKLFVTDPTGRLLLAVGTAGMVVGYFWIRKLVNIKY